MSPPCSLSRQAAPPAVVPAQQYPVVPPVEALPADPVASQERAPAASQQSTPVRAAAAPPAASASLTYAQRLKLSAGTPAASPGGPSAAAAPEPVAAAEPVVRHVAAEANGGHPNHHAAAPQPRERRGGAPAPPAGEVYGVFVRGLPGDPDISVEMLEAEFGKYGKLLGGRHGITISSIKFNNR